MVKTANNMHFEKILDILIRHQIRITHTISYLGLTRLTLEKHSVMNLSYQMALFGAYVLESIVLSWEEYIDFRHFPA